MSKEKKKIKKRTTWVCDILQTINNKEHSTTSNKCSSEIMKCFSGI